MEKLCSLSCWSYSNTILSYDSLTMALDKATANSSSSWLLFATTTSLGALTLWQHWRQRRRHSSGQDQRQDDKYYLQRAHQLRHALVKPAQSKFRVVAILLLENGQMIFGANDEAPPTISGSLCAERGAFLQYRLQQYHETASSWPMIDKIFIVTDAVLPIPPGLLCREYMYGHPAMTDTVPIVMQSADESSEPWISNLQELYPYPSLYMKLSVGQQLEKGPILAKQFRVQEDPVDKQFTKKQIHQVTQAAMEATQFDNRDVVHPVRYGAAAMVWQKGNNDWRVVRASQRKALEYGASQDAVAQLLSLLLNRNDAKESSSTSSSTSSTAPLSSSTTTHPILLVQVDQFGLVHPPFAVSRSFLVEHDCGDVVHVVVPDQSNNTLITVPASVLAPSAPQWK